MKRNNKTSSTSPKKRTTRSTSRSPMKKAPAGTSATKAHRNEEAGRHVMPKVATEVGDSNSNAASAQQAQECLPSPHQVPDGKNVLEAKISAAIKTTNPEQLDAFDRLIHFFTVPGVLAIIVAVYAFGGGLFGTDNVDIPIHLCALVLGAGRGGVPGAATVGGSFFILLAPPGKVNQMLALMTVAQSLPNNLVGFVYRKSAHWLLALKLNLFCVLGLVCGQYAVELMSDDFIKKFAGGILLFMVAQMTLEKVHEMREHAKSKGAVDHHVDGKADTSTVEKGDLHEETDAEKLQKKQEFLQSQKVLFPLGFVGGILSYVAGNMGPLLNVYMVFLELPKYELVATRAAIFIPNDAIKMLQRWYSGHLTLGRLGDRGGVGSLSAFSVSSLSTSLADFFRQNDGNLLPGIRLGIVGVFGVILAKIWLKNASKATFAFVHDRVTYVMTLVSGLLLATGVDVGETVLRLMALLTGK
ncbi:unnamed protein product [Amoebophrya sp. A120]|nr:unnamed protein product [Amoebophrya sp. A120]|eukprot:GSA120T00018139001.1